MDNPFGKLDELLSGVMKEFGAIKLLNLRLEYENDRLDRQLKEAQERNAALLAEVLKLRQQLEVQASYDPAPRDSAKANVQYNGEALCKRNIELADEVTYYKKWYKAAAERAQTLEMVNGQLRELNKGLNARADELTAKADEAAQSVEKAKEEEKQRCAEVCKRITQEHVKAGNLPEARAADTCYLNILGVTIPLKSGFVLLDTSAINCIGR